MAAVASDRAPLIATKYAPQPWRFTADSVVGACRASLGRLKLDRMALYIQHWPGFALNAFSNDAYLEGLARCAELGLTETVGVVRFLFLLLGFGVGGWWFSSPPACFSYRLQPCSIRTTSANPITQHSHTSRNSKNSTQNAEQSNFNAQRVRAAAKALKARGTSLSSNQVQYSLLYRKPEANGVLEACRENGVTLVAYSPLCQGLLSGE